MKSLPIYKALLRSLGPIVIAALSLSSAALAAEHSVTIDPGRDKTAQAVATVITDILTSRKYVVSSKVAGKKSEHPTEAYIRLHCSDQIDPYIASAMDQGHSGENYLSSRSLAQAIMDAYTTATQRTYTVVPDTRDLDESIPSCQVEINSFERRGRSLDYTSDVDQAWSAYIICEGIDAYFDELDSIQGALNAQQAQTLYPQTGQTQTIAQGQTGQTGQTGVFTQQQQPITTMVTPTQIPVANHDGEGALSPGQSTAQAPQSVFSQSSDEITLAQNKLTSALYYAYNALPANNGTWAVYACDLKHVISGYAPSTANQPMQAASLIKLFIMGCVYENYEAIVTVYGSQALDSYLSSMITVSDNDAANSLVTILGNGDAATGMQIINSYCQAHGYSATSMGRLLLASNEFGDNYTSVRDCGRFLTDIYRSCVNIPGAEAIPTPLPHAQEMFDLLKNQERRNKIPANLPIDAHVANKTGELSNVENDAGIIYDTANGNDLVLVFMSQNLVDTWSAQQTIAQVSRTLYDTYRE